MDGLQRKLNHSLQRRLSAAIAACIALVAFLGVFLSFLLMLNESARFQDSQLRQIAALIDSRHLPALPVEGQKIAADDDDDARITIQQVMPDHFTNADRNLGTGLRMLDLPAGLRDGLQTVLVNGVAWRVLVKPVAENSRIAIAQPTAEPEEVARHSAMETLVLLLLLIPFVILLVHFLIRKMFRPFVQLAEGINRRSDQDLQVLDDRQVPLEVVPFTSAINRLFIRVGLAIEHQRRFIADAAHELRSPLTALSLQVERLVAVQLSDTARERVAALQQGIHRARALIDQLLVLAHMQQQMPQQICKPVSLRAIIRQTLEDLMPLMESKNIDFEMTGSDDVIVAAPEIDLKTLIKNLLDNAIRYTPEWGSVGLHLSAERGGVLQVCDTGPGIPDAERTRVFDAFYRIPGNTALGSGLGLAIVKTIVDRLGASIELSAAQATAPTGLVVKVEFHLP
ncbi:MAG TPA: ATP-binding protein [Rhodocyclaceae bacterium]|nr:ATP-binding protein [Rhodocyclaceae bacterium]